MEADFSTVNHTYLSKARALSIEDPVMASAVLGIPVELTTKLASLSLDDMGYLIHLTYPLLAPRNNTQWWNKLFDAVDSGRQEAIDAVVKSGLLAALS